MKYADLIKKTRTFLYDICPQLCNEKYDSAFEAHEEACIRAGRLEVLDDMTAFIIEKDKAIKSLQDELDKLRGGGAGLTVVVAPAPSLPSTHKHGG